jgi:hypothetical protein
MPACQVAYRCAGGHQTNPSPQRNVVIGRHLSPLTHHIRQAHHPVQPALWPRHRRDNRPVRIGDRDHDGETEAMPARAQGAVRREPLEGAEKPVHISRRDDRPGVACSVDTSFSLRASIAFVRTPAPACVSARSTVPSLGSVRGSSRELFAKASQAGGSGTVRVQDCAVISRRSGAGANLQRLTARSNASANSGRSIHLLPVSRSTQPTLTPSAVLPYRRSNCIAASASASLPDRVAENPRAASLRFAGTVGEPSRDDGTDDRLDRDVVLVSKPFEPVKDSDWQLDPDLGPWHIYGTSACVHPGSPLFGNLL